MVAKTPDLVDSYRLTTASSSWRPSYFPYGNYEGTTGVTLQHGDVIVWVVVASDLSGSNVEPYTGTSTFYGEHKHWNWARYESTNGLYEAMIAVKGVDQRDLTEDYRFRLSYGLTPDNIRQWVLVFRDGVDLNDANNLLSNLTHYVSSLPETSHQQGGADFGPSNTQGASFYLFSHDGNAEITTSGSNVKEHGSPGGVPTKGNTSAGQDLSWVLAYVSPDATVANVATGSSTLPQTWNSLWGAVIGYLTASFSHPHTIWSTLVLNTPTVEVVGDLTHYRNAIMHAQPDHHWPLQEGDQNNAAIDWTGNQDLEWLNEPPSRVINGQLTRPDSGPQSKARRTGYVWARANTDIVLGNEYTVHYWFKTDEANDPWQRDGQLFGNYPSDNTLRFEAYKDGVSGLFDLKAVVVDQGSTTTTLSTGSTVDGESWHLLTVTSGPHPTLSSTWTFKFFLDGQLVGSDQKGTPYSPLDGINRIGKGSSLLDGQSVYVGPYYTADMTVYSWDIEDFLVSHHWDVHLPDPTLYGEGTYGQTFYGGDGVKKYSNDFLDLDTNGTNTATTASGSASDTVNIGVGTDFEFATVAVTASDTIGLEFGFGILKAFDSTDVLGLATDPENISFATVAVADDDLVDVSFGIDVEKAFASSDTLSVNLSVEDSSFATVSVYAADTVAVACNYEKNYTFYALNAVSVTYACLYDDTQIYLNGTLVVEGNEGSTGSFSPSAGAVITTNRPCGFRQGGRPLPSEKYFGRAFAVNTSRYQPHEFFIYLRENGSVDYRYNDNDGTPDPAMSVLNGTAGVSYSRTQTLEGVHYFYSEDTDFLLINKPSAGDHITALPADSDALSWQWEARTWPIPGSAGTTIDRAAPSGGYFFFEPDGVPFTGTHIADGAGGDADPIVPTALTFNTYAIDHAIADYVIVAVEPTVVSVSYWNGSGWTLYDTHDLSAASFFNPLDHRTGAVSGGDPYLVAAAAPWKFEGTGRFYMRTNNLADDEYTPHGIQPTSSVIEVEWAPVPDTIVVDTDPEDFEFATVAVYDTDTVAINFPEEKVDLLLVTFGSADTVDFGTIDAYDLLLGSFGDDDALALAVDDQPDLWNIVSDTDTVAAEISYGRPDTFYSFNGDAITYVAWFDDTQISVDGQVVVTANEAESGTFNASGNGLVVEITSNRPCSFRQRGRSLPSKKHSLGRNFQLKVDENGEVSNWLTVFAPPENTGDVEYRLWFTTSPGITQTLGPGEIHINQQITSNTYLEVEVLSEEGVLSVWTAPSATQKTGSAWPNEVTLPPMNPSGDKYNLTPDDQSEVFLYWHGTFEFSNFDSSVDASEGGLWRRDSLPVATMSYKPADLTVEPTTAVGRSAERLWNAYMVDHSINSFSVVAVVPTTITMEYWNNGWVTYQTYDFTDASLNNIRSFTESPVISLQHPNPTPPWRWTGTGPFYLSVHKASIPDNNAFYSPHGLTLTSVFFPQLLAGSDQIDVSAGQTETETLFIIETSDTIGVALAEAFEFATVEVTAEDTLGVDFPAEDFDFATVEFGTSDVVALELDPEDFDFETVVVSAADTLSLAFVEDRDFATVAVSGDDTVGYAVTEAINERTHGLFGSDVLGLEALTPGEEFFVTASASDTVGLGLLYDSQELLAILEPEGKYGSRSTYGETGTVYGVCRNSDDLGVAADGTPNFAASVTGADTVGVTVGEVVDEHLLQLTASDVIGVDFLLEDISFAVVTVRNQLITNWDGSAGDNTNFSAFTYDAESSGFRTDAVWATHYTDEYVRVNPDSVPWLYEQYGEWIGDPAANQRHYVGFATYDEDFNFISHYSAWHRTGTETTLAQDLNDGDMFVYLTDSANWYDASTNGSHIHSLKMYPYTSAKGTTYPDYTYSRHLFTQAWDTGAIDTVNHVIALNKAWSLGHWPAGSKIGQTQSGSGYNYNIASNQLVPSDWYTTTRQVGPQSTSGIGAQYFRWGSHYLRLLWLANRGGDEGAATLYRNMGLAGLPLDDADLSVTETAQPILVSLNASDTLSLALAEARDFATVDVSDEDTATIVAVDVTESLFAVLDTVNDDVNLEVDPELTSFATVEVSAADVLNVEAGDTGELLSTFGSSDTLTLTATEEFDFSTVVVADDDTVGTATLESSDPVFAYATAVDTLDVAGDHIVVFPPEIVNAEVSTTFVILQPWRYGRATYGQYNYGDLGLYTDDLDLTAEFTDRTFGTVSVTDDDIAAVEFGTEQSETVRLLSSSDTLALDIETTWHFDTVYFGSSDDLDLSAVESFDLFSVLGSSDEVAIEWSREGAEFPPIEFASSDELTLLFQQDVGLLLAVFSPIQTDDVDIATPEDPDFLPVDVTASDTLNLDAGLPGELLVFRHFVDTLGLSLAEARDFDIVAVTASDTLGLAVQEVSETWNIAVGVDDVDFAAEEEYEQLIILRPLTKYGREEYGDVYYGANADLTDAAEAAVDEASEFSTVEVGSNETINVDFGLTGEQIYGVLATDDLDISTPESATFGTVDVSGSDDVDFSAEEDLDSLIRDTYVTDTLDIAFGMVEEFDTVSVYDSDTVGLSAAEQSYLTIGFVAADDADLAVEEAFEFATVAASSNETLNVDMGGVGEPVAAFAGSDTVALDLLETHSFETVAVYATDTIDVVAEAPPPAYYAGITYGDTTNKYGDGYFGLLVTFGADDTLGLTTDDVLNAQTAILNTVTDTVGVALVDTFIANAIVFTSEDDLWFATDESMNLHVSFDAEDTTAIGLGEAAQFLEDTGVTAWDRLDVDFGLASSLNLIILHRPDTIGLSLEEQPVFAPTAVTDSDTLDVSAAEATTRHLSSSDSLGLVLERSFKFATVPLTSTDTLSVRVDGTIEDQKQFIIQGAGDTTNVGLIEATATTAVLRSQDTISVFLAAETASFDTVQVVADDQLDIADGTDFEFAPQFLTASDSVVVDTTSEAVAAIVVVSSDSLAVSAVDASEEPAVYLRRPDPLNIRFDPSTHVRNGFSDSDVLLVGVISERGRFPTPVDVSSNETLNVDFGVTGDSVRAVYGSDAIGVSVSVSSFFGTTAVEDTDGLRISGVEGASNIGTFIAVADSLDVEGTDELVLKGLRTGDSVDLDVEDVTPNYRLIHDTDTLSLSLAEAKGFAVVSLQDADSLWLVWKEASEAIDTAKRIASDERFLNVSVAEQFALFVTLQTTDSLDLSTTDAPNLFIPEAFTVGVDPADLSLSEVSTVLVPRTSSDTLDVSAALASDLQIPPRVDVESADILDAVLAEAYAYQLGFTDDDTIDVTVAKNDSRIKKVNRGLVEPTDETVASETSAGRSAIMTPAKPTTGSRAVVSSIAKASGSGQGAMTAKGGGIMKPAKNAQAKVNEPMRPREKPGTSDDPSDSRGKA